jgi:hypothetical protein
MTLIHYRRQNTISSMLRPCQLERVGELKDENRVVGVEPGQVQTAGTMEVVVLRNLWFSTRSDFGVYRCRLRRMPLTMLSKRLMLFHRRLPLRPYEVLPSKLGDLLSDFCPASMGQGSTRIQLHHAYSQQCLQVRSDFAFSTIGCYSSFTDYKRCQSNSAITEFLSCRAIVLLAARKQSHPKSSSIVRHSIRTALSFGAVCSPDLASTRPVAWCGQNLLPNPGTKEVTSVCCESCSYTSNIHSWCDRACADSLHCARPGASGK